MKSVAVVSDESALAAARRSASTSVPEAVPLAAVPEEVNLPVAESYTPV